MPDYQFDRECRTAHSESFVISADGEDVGRVDLHYADAVTYATLCLPEGVSEDDIQELIGEIDERLVMSNDPYRDDFIVTVWAGHQAGVYSEELEDDDEEDGDEEDEDEGEDEELEGNGRR